MNTHRQSGVALITAMLIVALVTVIAAYLSLGQEVWLRQTQNLTDLAQIDALEQGMFGGMAELLTQDGKTTSSDNLTEDWAKVDMIPGFTVEGGAMHVKVIDAQGLFNLNNLVRNAQPSTPDIGVFRRLLSLENADPNLADAVVDWLDPDSTPHPAGAEDADYMALKPPYRAGNRPFVSVEELRLVRGFTPEIVDKLRPFLVALPTATLVNINTAPPEILSALFPSVSVEAAQHLAADFARTPVTNIQQVVSRIPDAARVPGLFDVKSAYFLVQLNTQFGRMQRRVEGLISRPGAARAQLLWRSLAAS